MAQKVIKQLKKDVAPFEKTNLKASVRQLLNTLIPLVLLWYAAYLTLSISYWITLPISILASCFLVRTFIICHDCCHQSFFKSRRANAIVGTLTGILTFVPYEQWKQTHSIHHATSSNLDKRGIGDIWLMTVEEYISASRWRRLAYRMYRHPFVMFVLGPIAIFGIDYRFNRKEAKRKERINTYVTNISIVALYTVLCWAVGWQAVLLIQAPIFFVSGMLGIWLFYVQHQFEHSYFEKEEEWTFVQAAVEGSSYYKLPTLLQWLTGNIGFHHVHHLSPRVPNYYLEQAHEAAPLLQHATTITVADSLKSLKFRLWDEERKTFITFKQCKQLMSERRTTRSENLQPKTGRHAS